MRGKLATVIDQIEHSPAIMSFAPISSTHSSSNMKSSRRFCATNSAPATSCTDFGLRKGLDHLDEVRRTFQTITSRFAGYQAQWLTVHVEFPLLQRIALPITVGSVRISGNQKSMTCA